MTFRATQTAIALVILSIRLAGAEDLFIRDVLLVDGAGGPPKARVDILIAGDRIRAIEPTGTTAPTGRLIDGAGMTAVPGLIDPGLGRRALLAFPAMALACFISLSATGGWPRRGIGPMAG